MLQNVPLLRFKYFNNAKSAELLGGNVVQIIGTAFRPKLGWEHLVTVGGFVPPHIPRWDSNSGLPESEVGCSTT